MASFSSRGIAAWTLISSWMSSAASTCRSTDSASPCLPTWTSGFRAWAWPRSHFRWALVSGFTGFGAGFGAGFGPVWAALWAGFLAGVLAGFWAGFGSWSGVRTTTGVPGGRHILPACPTNASTGTGAIRIGRPHRDSRGPEAPREKKEGRAAWGWGRRLTPSSAARGAARSAGPRRDPGRRRLRQVRHGPPHLLQLHPLGHLGTLGVPQARTGPGAHREEEHPQRVPLFTPKTTQEFARQAGKTPRAPRGMLRSAFDALSSFSLTRNTGGAEPSRLPRVAL